MLFVMPGLVRGIHAFAAAKRDVDGQDKCGRDDVHKNAGTGVLR
jgi:hypothetical protein